MSSNFSTCDVSVSWPVNDVEGLVSMIWVNVSNESGQEGARADLQDLPIMDRIESERMSVVFQYMNRIGVLLSV